MFHLRHIAPHFKRFNSKQTGAIRQITEMQEELALRDEELALRDKELALRDDQLMEMQKTCEEYEEVNQNLLAIYGLFFKVFIRKLKTRLRIRL